MPRGGGEAPRNRSGFWVTAFPNGCIIPHRLGKRPDEGLALAGRASGATLKLRAEKRAQ